MDRDWYIRLNGVNVPVTEEIYRTYQRAEWRKKKHADVCAKRECSYDFMLEHDFDGQVIADKALVDEIVADSMLLDELYLALAELTDDERSLIDALYFKDQTAREYARKTDTNHSNINRRHKSIIEKLRKFLKNYL